MWFITNGLMRYGLIPPVMVYIPAKTYIQATTFIRSTIMRGFGDPSMRYPIERRGDDEQSPIHPMIRTRAKPRIAHDWSDGQHQTLCATVLNLASGSLGYLSHNGCADHASRWQGETRK
jgi:hypothetical protein